jgi:protein KRI1
VPKEDYGLTQEEILLLDDKQMNQLVSMKKLRPYRHLDENGQELSGDALRKQTKVNHGKIQKLKSQFKSDLDYKRKLVKENQLANLNLEKEQYLGTSGKISKAERKMQKQEKKNKKAKYIKHKKGGDGSEEGDDGEGEE